MLSDLNIFPVDHCFDFLSLTVENTTSHKYVGQNCRSMFRTILEVTIPSQILFNDLFFKSQEYKLQFNAYTSTIQPNDILI